MRREECTEKMNDPVKQHWVPRFYLKYFATPETVNTPKPRVWIFHRHDGDPVLAGVNDICAQNHLYSPADIDGKHSFEMESRFAQAEALLSRIWPQLATGFVDLSSPSLRKGIALLTSIMLVRTPAMLEQTKKIHDELVSFYETLPKDSLENPRIGEIVFRGRAMSFGATSYNTYKSASGNELQRIFVDHIKYSVGEIATVLLEKRWSVIVADEPVFITTDNPVTYTNSDLAKGTFGLKTKHTVVLFTLSPTRLLTMDDMRNEPSCQYYPLAANNERFFNILLWQNADRYMISSRHPDIVCQEMITAADSIRE
ncbi:MAG: DUF4238 domain-containing protein [Armatimonadota bacterium]|nr:DUF4238 domain-containing protein [bacterium]